MADEYNNEFNKMEEIGKWENLPEVKARGVGAYDKERQVPIKKTKLGLLTILSYSSIISMIAIAFVMGYSFYKNGELIPQSICAPNITIPSCPTSPQCPTSPACILTCPLVNCSMNPPTVVNNIYINRTNNSI